MPDHIPSEIDNAARAAARARELGGARCCENCGYSIPTALIRVRRVQLHKHHTDGRANNPATTVVLCLNCHAVVHENARDEMAVLVAPKSVLDRVSSVLRMHNALSQLMRDTQADLATDLSLLSVSLDEHMPAWRGLPEAAP